MKFDDLRGIFHTAESHATLYSAFDAAKSDLSTAITNIEELAQEWEGDDADEFRTQYAEAIRVALNSHTAIALNLRNGADSDLALQVALHFSIAGVLKDGQRRIDELSVRRLFGDNGISVLSATSLYVGTVGLAPIFGAGTSAVIGITGLLATAGSIYDLDTNLNPKTETIPGCEEVREVMTIMTEGARRAAESTSEMREGCASELRNLSDNHMDDIGSTKLVPGSGY